MQKVVKLIHCILAFTREEVRLFAPSSTTSRHSLILTGRKPELLCCESRDQPLISILCRSTDQFNSSLTSSDGYTLSGKFNGGSNIDQI